MTNNEIKENNKLIALFMGVKFNKDMDKCNHPLIKAPWSPIECLLYNHSWEWLMPVVIKISSIKDEDNCKVYHLSSNFLDYSEIRSRNNDFSTGHVSTHIKSMYLCVIDFLKWYNARASS